LLCFPGLAARRVAKREEKRRCVAAHAAFCGGLFLFCSSRVESESGCARVRESGKKMLRSKSDPGTAVRGRRTPVMSDHRRTTNQINICGRDKRHCYFFSCCHLPSLSTTALHTRRVSPSPGHGTGRCACRPSTRQSTWGRVLRRVLPPSARRGSCAAPRVGAHPPLAAP